MYTIISVYSIQYVFKHSIALVISKHVILDHGHGFVSGV